MHKEAKASLIILKKFEEAKARNARCSMRAFASKLGISSGALSEILQGKRVLSSQLKRRIADKLQLSPFEQMDFFEEDLPSHLRSKKLSYLKLSQDQYVLISDWWHYAILNLFNTQGFKPDMDWIARRLNLSGTQVCEAWERLLRLGLIRKNAKGYERTHIRLETSDDLMDLSIQKSHLEDAKLVENSLLNIPVNQRDHTSMTFVMNPSQIKKAKELIRIFQDQLSELMEASGDDKNTDKKEEVYKICVALFPLTQIISATKENQNEKNHHSNSN